MPKPLNFQNASLLVVVVKVGTLWQGVASPDPWDPDQLSAAGPLTSAPSGPATGHVPRHRVRHRHGPVEALAEGEHPQEAVRAGSVPTQPVVERRGRRQKRHLLISRQGEHTQTSPVSYTVTSNQQYEMICLL